MTTSEKNLDRSTKPIAGDGAAAEARQRLQGSVTAERTAGAAPPVAERARPSQDQTLHFDASEIYPPASTSARARQQWTIAIDLTTNVRDDSGQVQAGAQNKFEQLQRLAEESRGKPVTLVVSVPRGGEEAPGAPPAGAKQEGFEHAPFAGAAEKETGQGSPPQTIDTYSIHDGQVTRVESHQSDGMAGDVKDLLQTAQRVAPSDHLGLVVQAHGSGMASLGINGDTGQASMPQLHDAIKEGLQSGGRTQLDVLDFDACQMASVDTARGMHDVTRHMVGSSDEEIADDKHRFDSQNLGAVMHDLFKNPGQSSRELANDFVAAANRGDNGTPYWTSDDQRHERSGTDTLASMDMAQYPQFQRRLNDFGSALDRALQQPGNKEAIAAVTDQTGAVPGREPGYRAASRDSKEFAQGILRAVNEGKLRDQDGSVKRAAESLLAAQSQLVTDFHGSAGFYQNMGGLSVQLPATSEQSRRDMATEQTPIGDLRMLPERAPELSDKSTAIQFGNHFLEDLQQQLPAGAHGQLESLRTAQQQIEHATNQQQYAQALSQLRRAADQFLKTPAGQTLVAQAEANMHSRSTGSANDQWTQFLSDLSRRD